MGAEFRYRRTKTISPFVADADPNVSAPPSDQIFRLQGRPPSGNILTTGNTIVLEFRSAAGALVGGATADLQVWYRDQHGGPTGTDLWYSAEPIVGAGNLAAYITNDIRDAELFVQVLAVAGGAATVTVHVTET